MAGQAIQDLGTYAKGEIPEPLQIQFKKYDGTVIDLTNFTVKIAFTVIQGTNTALGGGSLSITSPATNGIVQYDWAATDLNEVGFFKFQVWANGGGVTIASEVFQYEIEEVTTKPDFS